MMRKQKKSYDNGVGKYFVVKSARHILILFTLRAHAVLFLQAEHYTASVRRKQWHQFAFQQQLPLIFPNGGSTPYDVIVSGKRLHDGR